MKRKRYKEASEKIFGLLVIHMKKKKHQRIYLEKKTSENIFGGKKSIIEYIWKHQRRILVYMSYI